MFLLSKYWSNSFPFFSSYSRFIIQIYFPAAANSQNVPSAAIVVNSLLTVALSVKYYFVVIIAIKSFLWFSE